MVDSKYDDLLGRFEREMEVDKSRDSEDYIRKFRFFQSREVTYKQKQNILLPRCRELGIPLVYRPKPVGVTKRKGKPREELKRHYTVHKVRGKMQMVARIPKGMKGAGRFAKRG